MSAPGDEEDVPRIIDVQVDVPATPEEVWEAIATGAGVSAWLQHTEIEEREGGRFAFDMGEGYTPNETGTVSAWNPPYQFATRDVQWRPEGESAPALLATEWTVTARAGGGCTVRMVMSGFGRSDAWDDELDAMKQGMSAALERLRTHLVEAAGQP